MTTHAESINSDLQRGLDRRLRHTTLNTEQNQAIKVSVAVAQWLRASNIFRQLCAGSSPVGSVGRNLNLQKLNYQYLTTSVAVVLVVR